MDRTPRYVPDQIVVHGGLRPVVGCTAYPRGQAPITWIDAPVVLEVRTDRGSRWFGVERAYINSCLRMVVSGINEQDEVRMRWQPVPNDEIN